MAVVNNFIFSACVCGRECNYDIELARWQKKGGRWKKVALGEQKCILNYVRAAEILGHCKLIKKHHTALAHGRK